MERICASVLLWLLGCDGYLDPIGPPRPQPACGEGMAMDARRVYPLAVGSLPEVAAIADFDEDHRPDLLVATWEGNAAMIFWGLDDGLFERTPQSAAQLGCTGYNVAIADFDIDGAPDFAMRCDSGEVMVYLKRRITGDRGFVLKSRVMLRGGSGWMVAGKVNRDPYADLLVSNGGPRIDLLLGAVGGGMMPPIPIPVQGDVSGGMILADLDSGQGGLDLAVTGQIGDAGFVGVLLGRGDGGFRGLPPLLLDEEHPAGTQPPALGRFTWGEPPALAVPLGVRGVRLLKGDGQGGFAHGALLDAEVPGVSVAAFDGDGDGRDELAVLRGPVNAGGSVALLRNDCAGNLSPDEVMATGGLDAYALLAGDTNGDQRVDILAAVNRKTSNIGVLRLTPR